MDKISRFLVRKRNILLAVFLALTVVCAVLSTFVRKNGDLKAYLPKDSMTRRGWEIMKTEFSGVDSTGTLKVMLKGLNESEKSDLKAAFLSIDGIESAAYDEKEDEKGALCSLFTLTFASKGSSPEGKAAYKEVQKLLDGKKPDLAGDVYLANIPILPPWVMLLAVGIVLSVLLVMSDSWLSPFLFLASILCAIVMNFGTNVIFGEISSVTDAIAAILQLALSMDYSIMLMARYRMERAQTEDKAEALQRALRASFSSVASSAQTTIVGLLTLVFMSFTIGRDMGFVLAKGVLLSMLCTFCMLPALITLFDRAIYKTAKKAPRIGAGRLASFAYKGRVPLTAAFAVIFVLGAVFQGGQKMTYTGAELDNVSTVFGATNDFALIYEKDKRAEIEPLFAQIEKEEGVDALLSVSFFDRKFAYDELLPALRAAGVNAGFSPELVRALYFAASGEKADVSLSASEFFGFLAEKIADGALSGVLAQGGNSEELIVQALTLRRKAEEAGSEKRDEEGLAKAFEGTVLTPPLVRAGCLLYASGQADVKNRMSLRELSDFLAGALKSGGVFAGLLDGAGLGSLASSFDLSKAERLLSGDRYERAVIRTALPQEGEETYSFVKRLNGILQPAYEKGAYLFGDSTYAYEMNEGFSGEYTLITILTMAAILLIVALTFRSAAIPVILVSVIQCAVFVTMSIMHFAGTSVFFLAVIVLQSILMGATIDYAILFTSCYREARQTLNVKDALQKAYARSIGTILTSSAILLIGTLLVGWTAIVMVSKICLAIGYGTLCATVLILFFTPAMAALFDRFVVPRKKKEIKKDETA